MNPKKLFWVFCLVVGLTVGGAKISGAESHYDDVFEDEIDEKTELEADEIEREELISFIEASQKVQEIRLEYTRKIHEAEEEEYQDLRTQALEEMVSSIEASGLDEDTYRGIAYHVDQDQELLSDFY